MKCVFTTVQRRQNRPKYKTRYLEDPGSDSTLHLGHCGSRSHNFEAANDRQRLTLQVWCKHVLVKVHFFRRHSTECFVFDKRKLDRVPCTCIYSTVSTLEVCISPDHSLQMTKQLRNYHKATKSNRGNGLFLSCSIIRLETGPIHRHLSCSYCFSCWWRKLFKQA